MTSRQVLETDIRQGVDEEVIYTLTTTPWGSAPTSVAVTVWDVTHGRLENVSGTVLTGVPSVLDDVITLPVVADLIQDHNYRVEVKFSTGGQIFEPYFFINAEL